MSGIDVKVGHVTKAGTNIFEDLGFAGDEARDLQDASQAEIRQLLALKEQLMGEITGWTRAGNLKQEQAAAILQVSRPRISDVVNMKGGKFTIDALVNMLARVGKPVRIVVGP